MVFFYLEVKNILIENTLFGEVNRVDVAIQRLQSFSEHAKQNHINGFIVCDSGGKDSNLIKELAYMADVPFEISHSHTTADHPLTVNYVREEQKRWQALGIEYKLEYPKYKGERTSMWELIALKGAPMRQRRWCCEVLKETVGKGRYIVTGVRWAESAKRKNSRAIYELPDGSKKERIKLNNDNDASRRLLEVCTQKGKVVVNPIIDWSDTDVWEFMSLYNISYNPLYDMGFKRVGCVGCPMANNKEELEKIPKYKEMYTRAFQQYIDLHPYILDKFKWKDGKDMYHWWVSRKGTNIDTDGQLSLFEELEEIQQS